MEITRDYIIQSGYTDPIQRSDGSWSAIFRFAFTYAIVSDIHKFGYEDRWCYKSYDEAKSALDSWLEDAPEPTGWHRHPSSGRRYDESGNLYINF